MPTTIEEKIAFAQQLNEEGNTIFRGDDPEKNRKALSKYTKVSRFEIEHSFSVSTFGIFICTFRVFIPYCL